MFRQLFKRLRGKRNPWSGVKDLDRITHAFTFEGVKYYQFEDIFNLCSGRAFSALDFYKEVTMGATREYLQAHTDAISELLDKAVDQMKIRDNVLDFNNVQQPINQVIQYNNALKQRCELILDHDAMYKLASVVFFDETEKPYGFDYRYNLETKIPAFKRMGPSFFLLMPVQDLIPTGDMSEQDLQTYINTQKQINDRELENLLSDTSENFRETETYKNLESLMNMVSQDTNSTA